MAQTEDASEFANRPWIEENRCQFSLELSRAEFEACIYLQDLYQEHLDLYKFSGLTKKKSLSATTEEWNHVLAAPLNQKEAVRYMSEMMRRRHMVLYQKQNKKKDEHLRQQSLMRYEFDTNIIHPERSFNQRSAKLNMHAERDESMRMKAQLQLREDIEAEELAKFALQQAQEAQSASEAEASALEGSVAEHIAKLGTDNYSALKIMRKHRNSINSLMHFSKRKAQKAYLTSRATDLERKLGDRRALVDYADMMHQQLRHRDDQAHFKAFMETEINKFEEWSHHAHGYLDYLDQGHSDIMTNLVMTKHHEAKKALHYGSDVEEAFSTKVTDH